MNTSTIESARAAALRVAHKIVPQLAEDIAQEALLRLIQADAPNPVPWAIVCSRNLSIDETRKRREAPLRRQPPARKSDASDVRDAVLHLDPDMQELVVLRGSNYSYRQIAAAKNMSTTCVYRKMQQLRHTLKDLLEME